MVMEAQLMMLSAKLRYKITTDVTSVGAITMEEIKAESERLGLPVLEIIRLLFEFLIDYRFTSKGY